jgi:hypothetical protein
LSELPQRHMSSATVRVRNNSPRAISMKCFQFIDLIVRSQLRSRKCRPLLKITGLLGHMTDRELLARKLGAVEMPA